MAADTDGRYVDGCGLIWLKTAIERIGIGARSASKVGVAPLLALRAAIRGKQRGFRNRK
jgi:hypothetical protein